MVGRDSDLQTFSPSESLDQPGERELYAFGALAASDSCHS